MFNQKICFYDTECNSLDKEAGFVQELAWAIYEIPSWRCIKSTGSLIRWNTYYEVDHLAHLTTGLTREFCEEHGEFANRVFTNFMFDVDDCDFIAGHNIIEYDNKMLAPNIKRALLYPLTDSKFNEKTFIDTMTDCPYPPHMKQKALKYLAFDHGYILSDAHQALADVFASKAIMSKYDFQKVLEIARTPMITLTVKTNWENKEAVEKLKLAKFFWNKPIKRHQRSIREFFLPEVQSILGPEIFLEKDLYAAQSGNPEESNRGDQQCFRGMGGEGQIGQPQQP